MISADYQINVEECLALVKGREQEFVTEFVQDLAEEVVKNTPVKTGFLRASWHASADAPYPTVIRAAAKASEGLSGNLAIEAINAAVAALDGNGVVYFSNGAAYAMRVEFGFVGTDSLGRKYNQAPRAFVRSVLDRAPSIAEATARRVAGS